MQFSSLQLVIAVYEFVILLFSLSFHECAHAWMASRLGDQTARLQGRVSLNPIRHIDPLGTLLFPALMIFGPVFGMGGAGMMIGWAKPTPVITRNFKNIRRDDNLTTLAGPASNLILVLGAFLVLAVLMVFVAGGKMAVISAIQMQLNPGDTSAPQALALMGMAHHRGQPRPLHLQPAAHPATGRQPRRPQHAPLQRTEYLRPDRPIRLHPHPRARSLHRPHLLEPRHGISHPRLSPLPPPRKLRKAPQLIPDPC